MIYKNKPECKTIATYVPVETYDALLQMANARTKRDGEWWSLSRLVREIILRAVYAEKTHQDLRKALLEATEDRHGRA